MKRQLRRLGAVLGPLRLPLALALAVTLWPLSLALFWALMAAGILWCIAHPRPRP
jgi:hypothetical protein